MLRLPRFQLIEPTTWTEAAVLLREHGAARSDAALGTPSVPVMLVAGGTDLFPNMKRRQFAPRVLVSLGRVKGAREISNGSRRAQEPQPPGMRIAAGATLAEIAAHPTVRAKYAALAQAAGVVSTPQLRNMGTIGGNLCLDTRCNWYDQSLFWRTAEGFCMKTHPSVVCRVAPSSARCLAVASADTVPALIALGARVTVENASGRRDLDLAELYREDGIRYLAIGRDDVVVGVALPDATGWRSTYLKLRDRNSFDFPIAGVAAAVRFDGATVTEARIAITALASRPVAVDASVLVGTKLDDDAIAAAADAVHKTARPMDNTSGTISQRKRASRVFTERVLRFLRDA
jgi:4-hydroxybenzoyl-CoA reductase subunit beta